MTAGRARLAVALALAAVAPAGCSATSGDDDHEASIRRVATTRVEVVEGLGRAGGFHPEQIYDRLAPGVVTVVAIFEGGALAGKDGGEGGQGSGFVLDGQGHIATNAHVVTSGRPPNTRRARRVFVEFGDGDRVPARIVGDDPNADVALLEVDPAGLSLTPLRLASGGRVRVGEPVAAIGSPFGERQSLTVGVVSALDRNIESLTTFGIGNAIQTDAAINPGNSGGPLLNARGQVLGINAQIKSESGGGEGVGFAIPVATVRRSLRELRAKGRVDYAYLGVLTQSLYPQLAERLGVDAREGALVVEVQDGSPARKAGLRAGTDEIQFQGQSGIPTGGDVIVAVDGRRLTRRDDLADVVGAHEAGDTVRLEVLRGGDRRETVEVELERRPASLEGD
ncbi:MAG: S1C family serine protease [Nocardioidaceae bacterium]